FFFRAEDGIRDSSVTGVQTCALPIYSLAWPWTDAKRVVAAWQKLAPTAPDGLFCVLNLNATAGSSASPNITSAGQFYGDEAHLRSEERRVGKECRARGAREHGKKTEE